MSDLVRKDSIEELIGHRDRALMLYRQGFETMVDAVAAHRRAAVGLSHITGLHWEALRFIHVERRERDLTDFMAKQRKELDGDIWRALLANTRLASMMDKVEREAFNKGLENPAEISMETVFATLTRLAGDAPTIFRRGLVEAFRYLSSDHRSNDGFRVGERMVIKSVVSVQPPTRNSPRHYVRTAEWGTQILRDVDRCLHVLSGRPPPANMQGIVQAVYEAVRADLWEAETDLMRVRWFKNGNGHVWIKSADLLRDVNHQIALHYGAALGTSQGTKRRNAV